MLPKVFLFVILAITISCEAKKIKFAPSHPYIYHLALAFREDKINDFIVDSFLATAGSESDKLLHCDIGLTDLLKAIPIKKLGISDFNNAYKELNLSHDEDDFNNLISDLNYAQLKEAGISFEKIYKSVYKTYFKDRPAALLEALRILGVAEEFSVAYTFGSDEDIFNALQNGNFSYYNLVEIGNLIEGPITLKELLNVLGLKKLDGDLLANFINNQLASSLVERGLTKDNLKNFLQALGLSVSNYKDSKSFKNCYNQFTQSKSLAVAVSNDELVTNDDSIVLKYLNLESYASLTAKLVQGSGISYAVLSENIKNDEVDNVIRIKINGLLPSFIGEASGDTDVSNQNCQYVSVYGDQLLSQPISANFVDDQLTVPKLFNTPFKKGSPLICSQKLHGLASVNNFNSIIFDYVQQKQQEHTPVVPVFPPIDNKPEAIQAIKDFFEKIHANFNPCKYFDCGVKEGTEPCPGDSDANSTEGSGNNSDEKEVDAEKSSDAVIDVSDELESSTQSANDDGESGEEAGNNSSGDQNVSVDQNKSEDPNASEEQNVSQDQNISEDHESSADDTPKSDSVESQDSSESNADENANVSSGSGEASVSEPSSNDVNEGDSESADNNNSANSEEAKHNSEQNSEEEVSNSAQNTEEQVSNSENNSEEEIVISGENVEEAASNSGQDADVAEASASEQGQQSNEQLSSDEEVQQEINSNSNVESEGNEESDNSSPENSGVDNLVFDSSLSDSSSNGNNDANSSSDNVNSPQELNEVGEGQEEPNNP